MSFIFTEFLFLFIGTSIQKKNLSNVQIVVKVFASHVPWPFIEFYTWKTLPINVRLAAERSISGATSKPTSSLIQTSNRTTAGHVAKNLGETVI